MNAHDTTTLGNPPTLAWRLAVAAALCVVPLVIFGGSVTTLGAGMAVEGWLIAEGHFLLFFPIESWLRDQGTFVEHTHRLCGVLVGLFAIGAVLAAWKGGASRAGRWGSVFALLAVCIQGAIGGFRVLESSPELAFLHGALAQAVFAIVALSALLLSPAWNRTESNASKAPGVRELGLLPALVLVATFAQILFGAWYRHSLRPSPEPGAGAIFILHVIGAVFVVLGIVLLHAKARSSELAPVQLAGVRRLALLLGLQIGLGIAAWLGYRPSAIGPLEWALSVAHVLVGGLMLVQASLLWAWTRHLSGASEARGLQPGGAL